MTRRTALTELLTVWQLHLDSTRMKSIGHISYVITWTLDLVMTRGQSYRRRLEVNEESVTAALKNVEFAIEQLERRLQNMSNLTSDLYARLFRQLRDELLELPPDTEMIPDLSEMVTPIEEEIHQKEPWELWSLNIFSVWCNTFVPAVVDLTTNTSLF